MDAREAFWTLHADLPREGPGSDATTRLLLDLAGPLPERPRALDVGCGPGRSALVLATEGAEVTAVDTHEPFLARLRAAADGLGLADRVAVERASMDALPFPDRAFDLVWSEGAAYLMGVDAALREWRPLLAPGGVLVFTEVGWTVPDPAPSVREFWTAHPGMRTPEDTATAARAAGYAVLATYLLPDRDWTDEYYGPLAERVATHGPALEAAGGDAARVLADARAEIALREQHPADYGYTAFVLRRRS